MRVAQLVAGLSLALGAAATVNAAPAVFLNEPIIKNIPSADRPGLRAAIAQALNQSADKQASTWTSTAQGRKPAVNVRLTPLTTTETSKSGRCRQLQANVEQGKAHEDWTFWFCQQPDGGWKASSN